MAVWQNVFEKKSRPHDLETKRGIFREETTSAGYYYYTLVLHWQHGIDNGQTLNWCRY